MLLASQSTSRTATTRAASRRSPISILTAPTRHTLPQLNGTSSCACTRRAEFTADPVVLNWAGHLLMARCLATHTYPCSCARLAPTDLSEPALSLPKGL